MPHTRSNLAYITATLKGRPQVCVTTRFGRDLWLTEQDLIELLEAIPRRKPRLANYTTKGDTCPSTQSHG